MAIPDHVPPELVVDFDRFDAPELGRCPHRRVADLFRGLPDIFYTPRDGGHFVVTRAAIALDMLRQPERFSSDPKYNVANRRNPRTLPNQADPPEHTELRRIVNPYFSPGGVRRIEAEIRARAIGLIEAVADSGSCEFLADIAQKFPVEIFLGMAGARLEDRETLIGFANRFTHEPDVKDRLRALDDLGNYLKALIAERERSPGADLISAVVQGQLDEQGLSDDDKLGMVSLLFLGGLDTVAAMLSFIMAFLARSPNLYAQLVGGSVPIANAVEELMRVHGVAGTERGVTQDMDYNGVQFRMGDRLLFMPQIYGLDEQLVDNPSAIDFGRPVSSHLVFGAGPHRCLGANLARVEIRVFLEEWTRRIPAFTMATALDDLETRGGLVWTPLAVPLQWEPVADLR